MGGRGLSREDVIKAFGLKEFQKGLAYCSDGNVLMAVEENGVIRGKVQGSMDRPYDVKVDIDDLQESDCSCPVGEMCKHCAALAIAYADGKGSSVNDIERRVDDLRSGSSGRIEYLKIMVEGNTDPLKADSDRDGILDGEEVDLGTDGWITNPMSVDSDGDGLLDRLEIKGFWRGGEKVKTDPTRADTDGDGVSDNMDICPLGDAVVKIDLLNFKLYDTLCQIFGMGGSSSPMTFFVLGSGDVTYFTDRFEAQKGQWRDPNMQYYFDVSDSASSITIDVQAWADNVDWGSGDLHLDIGTSGGNGWDYHIVYDALSKEQTPYYCDGKASGDGGDGRDGYLRLSVQTVTLPRVNTIVVNGTDYGLDTYGSEYRYSADEQVYMFYLNCSNAGGAFVQGLNAIIVPRAVLLGSSLNYTLFHLETVGSGHALNGASLSVTDVNAEQASSHIIAVISKNVTASDANTILRMLTHDTGGEAVGNALTVTSAQLLLMHLPLDVLNYVPLSGMANSPTGNAPVELLGVIVGTVMSAVDFLVNGIVALATFMLDLYVTIAKAGLAFLTELAQAAADIVRNVVSIMVDAFLAFVDWMIDFVCSAILAPIQSLCEGIWNGLDDWMMGLMAMIDQFSLGVEGGAISQSSAVHGITAYIINSDLVKIILAIGLAVFIAMLCVQPMISPYMFVIDLVVPIIMMVILGASSAFGTISSDLGAVSGLEDLLHSFLGSSLTDVSSVLLGMIFGVGGAFLEFFTAAVSPEAPMIICFLLSVFGGIIAFWEMIRLADGAETGVVDVLASLLSLGASGLGLIIGIISPPGKLDEKLCSGFSKLSKVTALIDFGISLLGYAIVMDAMAGD